MKHNEKNNEENYKLKALKELINTKGWNIFIEELNLLKKNIEYDIIYNDEVDIKLLKAKHKILTKIINRIYDMIEELENNNFEKIDFDIFE